MSQDPEDHAWSAQHDNAVPPIAVGRPDQTKLATLWQQLRSRPWLLATAFVPPAARTNHCTADAGRSLARQRAANQHLLSVLHGLDLRPYLLLGAWEYPPTHPEWQWSGGLLVDVRQDATLDPIAALARGWLAHAAEEVWLATLPHNSDPIAWTAQVQPHTAPDGLLCSTGSQLAIPDDDMLEWCGAPTADNVAQIYAACRTNQQVDFRWLALAQPPNGPFSGPFAFAAMGLSWLGHHDADHDKQPT